MNVAGSILVDSLLELIVTPAVMLFNTDIRMLRNTQVLDGLYKAPTCDLQLSEENKITCNSTNYQKSMLTGQTAS